jgi:DNA-binding CsgD family transcriptional regulator/cell division protein FtsB
MMRHIYILLVFVFLSIPAPAMNADSLEAVYTKLDQVLAKAPQYIAKRQQQIDKVKKQLAATKDAQKQYTLCYRLYELYYPYIHHDACLYLSRCITLAERLGRKADADCCRARLAKLLVGAGFYDEAREYLAQMNPSRLTGEPLMLYDVAARALYGELAYYTTMPDLKEKYDSLTGYYENAMMKLLPKDSPTYLMTRQNQLTTAKQGAAALKLNTRWLKMTPVDSHDYAMVTLYRYLAYMAVGDTTTMMYWVTKSVISDIEHGVADQGSIWELANQLMLRGDVERAYRYISFASQCANTFGARQRKWQVAPLMAYLADKYKAASEQSHARLLLSILALSIFFIIALVLLFIAIRQRNHVKQTRNLLYESNARLKDSNERLAESIEQLADSNRVKEEYIGRFLEMCSLYVNRMDLFKKRSARYLKSRQYAELERLIHGKGDNDEDAVELYKIFDSAFIHLFPHFVDDLNRLLRPEAQLSAEKDGQLSTSIRIFALIRLGINDSSKIAEFLHYSVNTIYNYRARVKKGALGNKDDFENKVKMIGFKTANSHPLGAG